MLWNYEYVLKKHEHAWNIKTTCLERNKEWVVKEVAIEAIRVRTILQLKVISKEYTKKLN